MISTKTFIAANVCWAAVAIAAFLSGRSGDVAKQESRDAVSKTALLPRPAGGAVVGASGDGEMTVSADGTILRGRLEADRMGTLFERAFREKNPILRQQMLANLMANLTPENLPAALAAFESEPQSDELDRVFRDFLYAWGAIDGEKAVSYALDPESPRKSWYGSVHAMMGWSAQDRQAAMAFVEKREPSEQTAWLHYGVFRSLLDTDVQAAAEYAKTNTKSSARGRAMDKLAERLFQNGGTGALTTWLNGIDHVGENDMVSYKTYAIRTVIDRLSREDPVQAKALIAENYGQPYVNFETLRHTASRISGGDAAVGMDWLDSLPEGKERSRAFGEMVEQTAERDPNVVAQWLNDRPDSPEFDSAAYIFSQQIVRDDPVSAVAWAQSIQGEEQRDKALKKVIKSWQKDDPVAANAWLQNNS